MVEKSKRNEVDSTNRLLSLCTSLTASRGNIQIVKLLLDAGADANVQDRDGVTPLHIAIKLQKQSVGVTIAELLLTHRANPNAPPTME
jgi:ankyrin repeat protein